ncbi:MAG: hypothetical protein WB502_11420 [Thermoactinomyces sp.]
MYKQKIVKELRELIENLVNKNYLNLYHAGHLGDYTPEEIDNIIKGYKGNLTLPPESAFENVYIYEVINKEKIKKFAIDFDLWFDNEQSDLTLQCDVVVKQDGNIIMEIYDIHVL